MKSIDATLELYVKNQDGVTETKQPCKLYYGDTAYNIYYDELLDEERPPVKTHLKFEDGTLCVTRSGEYGACMKFYEGETQKIAYNTPFGVLDIEILTKSISFNFDEQAKIIKIYLDTLRIDNEA